MATEGYIFAKLPKCYLMPQLQDWIMYRQCVTFSETDKSNSQNAIFKTLKCLTFYLLYLLKFSIFLENLMQATVRMWQLLEMTKMPKIEKPSLHMTKYQLKRLTYNQAEEIKKKVNYRYQPSFLIFVNSNIKKHTYIKLLIFHFRKFITLIF